MAGWCDDAGVSRLRHGDYGRIIFCGYVRKVRDEVIITFVAGHETSALAATYVWHLLSLHPEQEAKLHAELDAVLGGRELTCDNLEKLQYTRMAIEEAMRLGAQKLGWDAGNY